LARETDDGNRSARQDIIAIAEAIDRFINASGRYLSASPWFDALVALSRDVRDLLEADAHLNPDDVCDICRELMAHFGRLDHKETEDDDPYLQGLARWSELRDAHANCLRVLRGVCFGEDPRVG